jgi:hypothetical protein
MIEYSIESQLGCRNTCFSINEAASSRIWSSSWFARSFAFTAAAERAETAARFSLSMLLSSLITSLSGFSFLLSFGTSSAKGQKN